MFNNSLITRRKAFWLSLGGLTLGTTLLNKDGNLSEPIQTFAKTNKNFTVRGKTSLTKRAAVKGFIYGAATDQNRLYSDTAFATRFAQECGILVPENDLKWYTNRPAPNRFNFTRSDWLAKFARAHNMLFRGHTLVWHRALPKWFKEKVNSNNAEELFVKHITTVAQRYTGQMHSWDVVNEAIEPDDKRTDGLRNTPWLKFLGSDYIELAFRIAAEADPKALLVYNDYKLEYDSPADEAKRYAVLKLLQHLKSRGTPIHALGIQSHLYAAHSTRFNSSKLRKFLADVASLGLKILITELDVNDKKLLPLSHNQRDRIVAGVYEDYLSVVLDEPAVIAVLTWGLSDRYSWLNKRSSVRPLPLDSKLKPKLAWNAIARAFDHAPKR